MIDEKLIEKILQLDIKKVSYVTKLKWIFILKTLMKLMVHQTMPPLSDTDWTTWLLQSGRGAGKLISLDTPIPVPGGWKLNGDLIDGDQVFDEHGQVCTVIKAHEPVVPEKMYRMTFSDNSFIDCGGEHLWTVWTHQQRKQYLRHGGGNLFPYDWANHQEPIHEQHGRNRKIIGHLKTQTYATEELLTILHQDTARGDLNLCIPNALPLQLPEADLPIDPYLLGYWLGNGYTQDGSLCCGSYRGNHDHFHIEAHLRKLNFAYTLTTDYERGSAMVNPKGLLVKLREHHLLGNKHIPAHYLRASITQRLALLRGLCDSDGTADSSNCEFYNKSELLAKQVYELVCSLGERVTLNTKRAIFNGKDYGICYTVRWRWTLFNPFSLPRKANLATPVKTQGLRMRHRMITSITPIEPRLSRCITVDSPNHLYLCGEQMVPTHNTHAAVANVLIEGLTCQISDGAPMRIASIGITDSDTVYTLALGDSGFMQILPAELLALPYSKSSGELVLISGSSIRLVSATAQKLRGPQYHLIHCDEMAAITPTDLQEDTLNQMGFCLRLGKYPRQIITTTPQATETMMILNQRAHPGGDVIMDRVGSQVNFHNLGRAFKRRLEDMDKNSDLYRSEVMGELISIFEKGHVKLSDIRLWPANKRMPEFQEIFVSLDSALTGEQNIHKERTKIKSYDPDYSAFTVWGLYLDQKDKKRKIMLLDAFQERLETADLIDRCKEIMRRKYGASKKEAIIPGVDFDPSVKFGPNRLTKGLHKNIPSEGRGIDYFIIEAVSAGLAIQSLLYRENIRVHPYFPYKMDKLSRLHAVSHLFAKGFVVFPMTVEKNANGEYLQRPATWTNELVRQLCSFTHEGSIRHDDMLDSCTQALIILSEKNWFSTTINMPGRDLKNRPVSKPPKPFENYYAI